MRHQPELRLNIEIGQWATVGDELYRLIRRAGDRDRRLVFESPEGLPFDVTDAELLEMQHGKERSLRLLSAEAQDKLAGRERPRINTYTADSEEESAETIRRLEYVRGWVRAGRPSRTAHGIKEFVERTFCERRAEGTLPVEGGLRLQGPSCVGSRSGSHSARVRRG